METGTYVCVCVKWLHYVMLFRTVAHLYLYTTTRIIHYLEYSCRGWTWTLVFWLALRFTLEFNWAMIFIVQFLCILVKLESFARIPLNNVKAGWTRSRSTYLDVTDIYTFSRRGLNVNHRIWAFYWSKVDKNILKIYR